MLEQYNKKRDFKITPEPSGKAKPSKGPLTFVIQKHDARRLHYDFRLEIGGVLVSWAVPKGPSLDPADKRFAVQTEDHPMAYAGFEGVIPAGQYGAGEVIVWDKGTYTPDEDGVTSWDNREEAEKRMKKMLEKGKLSIFLEGEKLRGSWALVHMKGKEKDWLLIKHNDSFTDRKNDITQKESSVDSGRTLNDVKEGRAGKGPSEKPSKAALDKAKTAKFPRCYEPMLAALSEGPFNLKGWVYEPKLDGIRAISYLHDGDVELQSRRGLDLTTQYPSLARALASIKENVVLDGEIVALDESGRPSFQLLQKRLNLTRGADIKHAEQKRPIIYYVFDILHWNNKDLRGLPLAQRKEILHQVVVPTGPVRLVESFSDDGDLAYKACIEHGLEGIVGKRLDSPYESGKRSPNWLKVKPTQSSEFVICGYTEGTGSRKKSFGSLILGERTESGDLKYVGGAGTGFTDKSIQALLATLKPYETKECPFKKRPPGKLNPTWVRAELVAEIKFMERTDDGMLRAPVFLRLREDISPEEAKPAKVIPVKEIKAGSIATVETSKKATPPVESAASKEHKSTSKKEAPNSVRTDILDQLTEKKEKMLLEVDGNSLSLTNLDKVFWPEHGKTKAITKRDFLIYLTRVAHYILPHLKDRPVTLVRFPNGIHGGKFYQKHVEKGLPGFVETVRYFTEQANQDQDFLLCNNISTLLWLGQMADLELHTVHTRVNPEPDAKKLSMEFEGSVERVESSILNYPDYLVIDLDPYLYSGKEKAGDEPELHKEGFKRASECALWLKDLLDSLKLNAFLKTSGRTGLHIYIPIIRDIDYATVRAICEVFGRQLLKDHPNALTMDWAVVKRTGKVFYDHNMNARGKSLASIYSPRVAVEASISTPLEWNELHSVYPTDFTMETVPERLSEIGDLWSNILDKKNDLNKILGKTVAAHTAEPKTRRAKKSK
ncbi:MAG TPA: non-homologous end-joining DNA ligase [Planktothrix sp.]|jgi:bifunctional non-homologous end joining protein LigD